MSNSHFWSAVNQYVITQGASWPTRYLRSDKNTQPQYLVAYFALSHAIKSGEADRLELAADDFVAEAVNISLDTLGHWLAQILPRLPQTYGQRFYPFLDGAALALWHQSAKRDLACLLKAVTFEVWEHYLSNTLNTLKMRPDLLNTRLLVLLLRYHTEIADPSSSSALWQTLIKLSFDNPHARREMLRLACRYPDLFTLEIGVLEQVKAVVQTDAESLYYLSRLWLACGNDDTAAEAAWQTVCIGNPPADILTELFTILATCGRSVLAKRCAGYLLQLSEVSPSIWIYLGAELLRLDDFDQAEKALCQAKAEATLLSETEWQQVQINLLQIALKSWPYEKMRQQYEEVKAVYSDVLPFYLDVCEAMIKNGEPQAALNDIEKFSLTDRAENRQRAYLLYASALEETGRLDEALQVLSKGFDQLNQSPELIQALLLFSWRRKKARQVEKVIGRAYTPPDPKLRALFLICLEQSNLFDAALRLFDPCIETLGETSLRDEALKSYIFCLSRQGRWNEVYQYLPKLSPNLLESQWGQAYFLISTVMVLLRDKNLDASRTASLLERLLAYPLTRDQLDGCARVLREVFKELPELRSEWRFKDIEAYLLLHVADRVERCLETARRKPGFLESDVKQLEQELTTLSFDNVSTILNRPIVSDC